MSTIEEVKTLALDVVAALEATDAKLDEIKTFIETLKAGSVTQEQIDALGVILTSAKDKAAAGLAEADALDDVTPPPVNP